MNLRWAVVLAAGLGTASAEQSATERYRGLPVRDVRLVLDGAEIPEAAPDLIDVEPGEPYRPETVRRSIQQLFALGAFSDIKVEAERVEASAGGDQVDILFRLFPRLEVQAVRLRGLNARDTRLAGLEARLIEESRLRPGDPLDVDALSSAAERIEEVLNEEGYLWAAVEPEAAFQSPRAVVVFHVDAGRQARVSNIRVEGVAPHVEAHIRREIDVREGGLYSQVEIAERVEAISNGWQSRGYYQAELEVEAVPAGDELVLLTLKAHLGPRVEIQVDGGEFSEKDVQKLVPLFEEALLTEDLIEESRGNLEEHLLERGHRDAVVDVRRQETHEGHELVLTFDVEPGARYETMAIEIEGLASVDESEVRSLLETRTRRRFRSAPYREDVWRADLEVVRSYLRDQGFHQASVSGRERANPRVPTQLTLVAGIEEGPRAFIASLGIEGASELHPEVLLNTTGIVPGDPFDPSGILEARDRILAHYQNQGFRQVAVRFQSSLNEEGTQANVDFEIDEGTRTRVDRVILSGLQVSKETSVRRLVTLDTGQPLSSIDLLETRQKLVASGLFRSVDIEVLPPDPQSNRSDVLITLVEGPRTTFAYGFGFEERQLFRAEVEVTRRNVFGLNRTVSVFTRASFRGGRFITTFRQPDSIFRGLPLFVSAYAEKESRTSFDYNRVGMGLQISKRLSEEQNLFFRYRFDRTEVLNVLVDINTIDRRFRNVRIGALSAASLVDGRDDPLNPTRGQFRILDLEWSSDALGTEVPYLKGLARQFFYVPLPANMVAALGVRVGIADTFGEDPDLPMPIVERFFAGGATTLRGFALDQASPKASVEVKDAEGNPVIVDGEPLVVEGDPIGGNVLTLLNLELRFPILGNLRGVFFSDNGAVYPTIDSLSFSEWRYNMGFGFRYDTPLGPLRVDYGFKLDRRTRLSIDCPEVAVPCSESLGRFHVSLGHAF